MSDRAVHKPGKWRPILDGELRERALASVRSIAASLELQPEAKTPRYPMQLAEQALLNAYLGFGDFGDRHFDLSSQLLDRAIDAVAETPMRPSLYGGFVGVAWAIEHLQNHELSSIEGNGSEDADPNGQVDAVLREYLGAERWNDSYDLISGLVGIGVYVADRLPRAVAKQCFERVIEHLAKLARPMDAGITWWTPPEQLVPTSREEHPQGHANLGVAHGVPAAIALVAQARANGVPASEALLSRSLAWLLSQKSKDSGDSYFGYSYAAGSPWRPARAAWCYGDPGISAALLCAARWTSDSGLEREALEIALRAAQRPADRCGVVDAPLCHGAAGLGHLYNRMFQATGDRRFMESALSWYERALGMRREGEGIGGYLAWRPGEGGWAADRSLLAGATGIALALLAAATPVEPSWDRLLLTSLRPIDF
jgi:lantibiotic modifying enzyme